MPLFRTVITAALIVAPSLAQGPSVFPVSTAGVVVTYGGNSSSVVVPPEALFQEMRADAGIIHTEARPEAKMPKALQPAAKPDENCDDDQNCGLIAPPM